MCQTTQHCHHNCRGFAKTKQSRRLPVKCSPHASVLERATRLPYSSWQEALRCRFYFFSPDNFRRLGSGPIPMDNRALFHLGNGTCYIVSSINTSSSRLNRNKVFQSCSFLWVRDSCFLTPSLNFFLPALCPLALVQVRVPMKDLDLHGIPSGLYTVSMFLPSSHFARACKASLRLGTLFLYYPNHPFLSFPPCELNFRDNQNFRPYSHSEESSQLPGECRQHLPFCQNLSLPTARVVFTLSMAMFLQWLMTTLSLTSASKSFSPSTWQGLWRPQPQYMFLPYIQNA